MITRKKESQEKTRQMNRIAQFEKVSYKQFMSDYIETFKLRPESYELVMIEKVYNSIILPVRATKGSAGYDFKSPFDFTLHPGQTIKIPTAIRCKIDEGWVLQIYPRSGLGTKYRVQLDNTIGIIDSDYYNSRNEGHIFIKITNDSKDGKELNIKAGDSFVQGIFVPYGITFNDDVDTERNGGFGSTGR